MQVRRATDAKSINAILNDPFVRPDVADLTDGVLDLTDAVRDRNNVFLVGNLGGTMFIKIMPGVYEVHTAALAEGRGGWILKFAASAVSYMFTQTDCFEIITRIPRQHRGAKVLAEKTGMRLEFSSDIPCRWRGEPMAVDVYSFRIQDWAKSASDMDVIGAEFHEFLHEEAERLGVEVPAHEAMLSHNRYVGIAVEMFRNGQLGKAVSWYNRHAIATRHSTIELVSVEPPIVKIDIGWLRLVGNRFEVLGCGQNSDMKIAS